MTPFWRKRLLRRAEYLVPDDLWVGERTEEAMAKAPGSDCLACGETAAPEPSPDGGLQWRVTVCSHCTQEVAARALRRMLPKLLRAKLEQP